MGSKVEKIEVALAQNIPFEDEVVELAPKFISAETPEKAPTASGRGGGDSATPSGPAASVEVDFSVVPRLNQWNHLRPCRSIGREAHRDFTR